jgi:cytochrome c oxidase assembly protein subunit 15
MFVLQLGLIGACIALLPLSWAWMKADDNRFRKLVWVTTFMTLDLVMFGGFTRLTDSGLGCPDWPGCYGTSSPFIAHAQIAAAHQLMPEGPVSMMKAWIEMIHRYFATSIGVVILVQMGVAWWVFFRQRPLPIPSGGIRKIFVTLYEDCRALRISPWWPTSLALLIIVQGIFGAWTVTLKLQPIIVSTHLLLGLGLLGSLGWFGARLTPLPAYDPDALRWRWAALAGLALLVLQIALGGWVSTNYAMLACTDFPTCNGAWIPPMDFHHGFQLWRALGMDSNGGYITQDALVAIHWTHRTFAFAVFAYLAWLALRLRRFMSMRRPANWILILLAIQFLTGLSNIELARPLAIAVAHNGGAAILLLLVVMLNFRAFSARAEKA